MTGSIEGEEATLGTARALANPLRQRILRELRRSGPATSTTLAKRLGVTSGGTSYNLRVLAEHGLIEEVPERAHGRQRWWRHVQRDLMLPPRSGQGQAMAAALEELNEVWLTEDFELFGRFQRVRAGLGDWADALPYSRGSVRLTLDQLKDFFADYLELLRRYRRLDVEETPGARTVLTRFVAFPEIPEPPPDD